MTLISIHSLRVEGDTFSNFLILIQLRFQSTPSVWRETYIFFFIELKKSISIHSLRVEGDRSFHNFGFRSKKFQSTPSVWRETSGATRLRTGGKNFNPLPPCGGRRSSRRNPPIWIAISIHSLRVEGDERTGILTQLRRKFQSTPSVWRETMLRLCNVEFLLDFNPLPPCGGRRCCPVAIFSTR